MEDFWDNNSGGNIGKNPKASTEKNHPDYHYRACNPVLSRQKWTLTLTTKY